MRKTKKTRAQAGSIPSDKADLILAAIREMETRYDQRFDGIDQRFETMDRRFDGMDQRFETMDRRFDGMDQRFDAMDKRFDGVDEKLKEHDTHFVSIEDHLSKHDRQIAAANKMLLDHNWKLMNIPTKEDYEENTRRILGAIESLTGHFERLETESKITSAQIDRIGTHLKKHDEEILVLKTKVGLAS